MCLYVCRSSSSETENGDHSKNEEYKESTTLQIRTAAQRPNREFHIVGATKEMLHGEHCGFADFAGIQQEKEVMLCHKISPKVIETPKVCLVGAPAFTGETGDGTGPTVELRLSLSPDRHKDSGAPVLTALRAEKYKTSERGSSLQQDGNHGVTSAPAMDEDCTVHQLSSTFQIASGKAVKTIQTAETKEPPLSMVEVILDYSDREKEESRSLVEKGCADSQVEGGQTEAPPSLVSFGISSEGTEQGEDDQQSEKEHSRPHKHRARHASKYAVKNLSR